MIHTASNSMKPRLTPNLRGAEDDRDDGDDDHVRIYDNDDDENAVIHPVLSPIAACNIIWNPFISPK